MYSFFNYRSNQFHLYYIVLLMYLHTETLMAFSMSESFAFFNFYFSSAVDVVSEQCNVLAKQSFYLLTNK